MDPFDFSTGTTNPETFPTDDLAEAAARAVRSHGVELNTYPGRLGHEGLRRLMAQREFDREGVRLDPDRIALTNGSMQAVTLVCGSAVRGTRRPRGHGGVLLLRHHPRLSQSRHRDGRSAGRRPGNAHRCARGNARTPARRRPRAAFHLRARKLPEPHRPCDAARAARRAAAHRPGAPLHRGGGQLLRRRPL